MAKVAIVGAGAVGTTIAYACLLRGIARELALYDVDEPRVRAEALDLRHGLQFVPPADVVGGADVAVCGGADVVVVTAGAKQRPGQSRSDLAEANIDLCRRLVPRLVEVAPHAILLLVTNPVDVVTYAALRFSGLPPSRVFGSGTVLDSSRLRFLLARRCDVGVQSVHATIAGEHGETELPLWSSATIGAVPVADWPGLDEPARAEIAAEVTGAAARIIAGKGATNYAVGLAAARIVGAILDDERAVLPVSALLRDRYGIDDVCLSLPAVVGREGVEPLPSVPLSEDELAGLRASAEAVRAVARAAGL